MERETLAGRIKEIRKRKGFSLQKVGNALGLSKSAISKWENNQASPSVKNLLALANFFDVEPVFLIYGVIERRTPHDKLMKKISMLNDSEAALLLSLVDKLLHPRTDLDAAGE